jgi:hypothetical protein
MKNIHILPTDKPSRLAYDFDKLILNSKLLSPTLYKTQNIYITNDEEIKEGDSFTDDNNSLKRSYKLSHVQFANPKKIILTTDQDLIKDGVQAIDDEFLQWFVKDNSCEKVEVIKNYLSNNGQWKDVLLPSEWEIDTKIKYKIIIPQEEPRLINNCPKCGLDLVERAGCKPVCTRIDCGGIILSNETLREWALKEEPKQETLEEAAERMYSEEDMVNFNEWTTIMYPNQRRFLTTSDKRGFYTTKELLTKWFEQFKKQNNEQ